ncbi:MAG: alpha/beta fold hydrolase, partial [Verrucomicrobiales bacterium]
MSDPTVTRSQFFSHGSPEQPVTLAGGGQLPGYTLAYETWGTLNAAKDNAVLIFHALSGTHHIRGFNAELPEAGGRWTEELHQGWWEDFVGPGKMIDTDRFFVICANYLGGCYGSTGPASTDPRTSKPYGSSFPHLAVSDLVESNIQLLNHLGIGKLHAVVGSSVGGLCALTLATSHPQRVDRVVSLASGFKTTVLNRLILFEQILAIENDRHFNGGDYYEGEEPRLG